MNHELNELINRIKTSNKPVQEVVDEFFQEIVWSALKAEFERLTDEEKLSLITKLGKERK